ncbi:hypothetical protein CLCR_07607 [Cladophialophora carrionii]|uniref:GPI anchored protein n=1 Tax=Cladophialophora carrionii TaxID=86049 RepID=A0A1C1CNT0_9EURO|nr:hypothetical protein CLCR_07607 [Cladophialophora carrionii]
MFFLSSMTAALIATVVSGTNIATAPTTSGWESAPASSTETATTLCQFLSSIPGVLPNDTASMTLPLCPSSFVSFSYTIPPPAAQTTPAAPATSAISSPESRDGIPGTQDGIPGTFCQFFSSIPGLESPTGSDAIMTFPPCSSSLLDVTYTYLNTVKATETAPTITSLSPQAVSNTQPVVATFTGLAARQGVDERVLGGALAVLVAMVGMR